MYVNFRPKPRATLLADDDSGTSVLRVKTANRTVIFPEHFGDHGYCFSDEDVQLWSRQPDGKLVELLLQKELPLARFAELLGNNISRATRLYREFYKKKSTGSAKCHRTRAKAFVRNSSARTRNLPVVKAEQPPVHQKTAGTVLNNKRGAAPASLKTTRIGWSAGPSTGLALQNTSDQHGSFDEEHSDEDSSFELQDLLRVIVPHVPCSEQDCNRPTFRFIHLVIGSVMKKIGFAAASWQEFERLHTRNQRLAFLEGIVSCIERQVRPTVTFSKKPRLDFTTARYLVYSENVTHWARNCTIYPVSQ